MSRTDKTDPAWLQIFRAGRVDHDHRSGVCHVETLHDAVMNAGRSDHHRNSQCAKHTWIFTECPGHIECYWAESALRRFCVEARLNNDGLMMRKGSRYNARKLFRCSTHKTHVFSPDVYCAGCESAREFVTCDVNCNWHRSKVFYDGGAPASFRAKRERAGRRAARGVLHEAVRDWNGNGETDVSPEPLRHRNNADWLWD